MSDSQNKVAEFVQARFPDQVLIPVSGFARLSGESFGGIRNRIADGTFPFEVIRRGQRNFVSRFDVIDHLSCLLLGEQAKPVATIATAAKSEVQESRGGRRSKYGEDAKARAAATKARRQAAAKARQARAEQKEDRNEGSGR